MKGRTELKPKGPRKANPRQAVYELKHRAVLALNKIADRDTYQIGVEELSKTAESLNPDGIIPFLSCVLDTDSEQKSAVRKECVRMMGVLVKMHGALIGPHLGKMVASIVKRLKDQDSVVRDTCVETMSILASEFGNSHFDSDGIFVLLVRPLFEALGEQNKQIQSGAAMCLARVIDNMNNPPVSILQKMLVRTMKLLNNPHFMAKPAVIELKKSLIQAGGALSHSALSTAICSIQEVLKDTDWTTRKAASLALGEIASSGGSFLAPFKVSCTQALESCRFDKVKPVRDAVSQALSCWKSIEDQDVPEPSGNVCGDEGSDLISAGSSIWKDGPRKESKTNMVMKKASLPGRKGHQEYSDKCNRSNNSDWHVDIAVPKTHNGIPHYLRNEESESSSATKTLEAITADVISMQDIGNEYDLTDEKQEYSSASNHVSDNFTNRFVTAARHRSHRGDLKSRGDQLFPVEGNRSELHLSKMTDRRSLDSTVTDTEESEPLRVSCSHTENEISSIRKQLLEIEKKQSSLMDLLQVFTTSTMESLSTIKLKVSSLEHAVDRIAHDVQGSKHASMNYIEKCQSVAASPAISTYSTPRTSVDMRARKSSVRPLRNNEVWEGKGVTMKSNSTSVSPCLESRRQPLSMMNRSFIREQTGKSSGQDLPSMSYRRTQKNDRHLASALNVNGRQNGRASESDIWNRVKSFLCEGDLDSAYKEALNSGNQLVLIELINGTGPVLNSLSRKAISDLLTALASCALEHRIVDSLIPWLQQIVDLSALHGPNYIPLSLKVRREIIAAVQDALDVEVTHPSKRRMVAQLAMKLQQIWGQ